MKIFKLGEGMNEGIHKGTNGDIINKLNELENRVFKLESMFQEFIDRNDPYWQETDLSSLRIRLVKAVESLEELAYLGKK